MLQSATNASANRIITNSGFKWNVPPSRNVRIPKEIFRELARKLPRISCITNYKYLYFKDFACESQFHTYRSVQEEKINITFYFVSVNLFLL